MAGLRVDITDGAYEFHRDDEGNVIFTERTAPSGRPEIVIIPAEVWRRNWARLVSMAEFDALASAKSR
jgi:hypothetical protein